MEVNIEQMITEDDELIVPMSIEYREDITADDFRELCRLCGNRTNQLMPIFAGDGLEHDLSGKIKEYLPISVSFDDDLPSKICYQCASTLISWHELYYACKEADQRLKELSSRLCKVEKTAESFEDVFEEKYDYGEDVTDSIFAPGEIQSDDIDDNTSEGRFMKIVEPPQPTDSNDRHRRQLDESLPPSDVSLMQMTEDIVAIDLNKFIFVHKNGIKYMQCDKCSYICRPAVDLFLRHYSVHHLQNDDDVSVLRRKVQDENDSLKFTPNHQIQRRCTKESIHETVRGNSEIYQCYLCEKTFRRRYSMRIHLRNAHDIETYETEKKDKAQAISVCPVCGKKLSSSAMTRHMTIHSDKKPYICDMCGKRFRVKWSLREHIMVEIGMKDYVCEICGRKFVIQAYLNKHMRFHQMDDGQLEGHQCEICGKKFPEMWRVTDHQRKAHTPKKQAIFECDICGNKYTHKWLVRSHKRVAHKEFFQTYQCEHCGKTFVEKWMIKLHLRTLHNVHMPMEVKSEEPETRKRSSQALRRLLEYERSIKSEIAGDDLNKLFQCELCKKTFSTKQNMKNHWHAELNLRKYACEFCGKRYNWWMGLKEHLIVSHGEKEYMCGICGKEFPTKSRYQNHMAVHSDTKPYVCDCGSSFKLRRYLTKHQRQYCKMTK